MKIIMRACVSAISDFLNKRMVCSRVKLLSEKLQLTSLSENVIDPPPSSSGLWQEKGRHRKRERVREDEEGGKRDMSLFLEGHIGFPGGSAIKPQGLPTTRTATNRIPWWVAVLRFREVGLEGGELFSPSRTQKARERERERWQRKKRARVSPAESIIHIGAIAKLVNDGSAIAE